MTTTELYKSVAQLGFETSLEDAERFLYAANRALLQVNALRPATRAYVINHKPLENKVTEATFKPIDKEEDLYFVAEGVKSYYFEADGNGMLYIEQYENGRWNVIGTVELSGTQGFRAYNGFIKKDGAFISTPVRLHFTGEYFYSVKNVALYKQIYSAEDKDIPAYEPFTRYDISALVDDFLSLATPPLVEGEGLTYLNQEYSVENGRIILLPYGKKGLYKVIYNHKPTPIKYTGDEEDDSHFVIDLDDELCALLPILIASYVWVDDEPEKANYYLNLYRERAMDTERRIYNAAPVQMKNKSGW